MQSQTVDGVLVKLEGDTRLLGLSVLKDLADAVDLVTRGMEEGEWFVSSLTLGSYAICTSPVDYNPEALKKLLNVVDGIVNRGELSLHSTHLVDGLKKLGNLTKRQHVSGISVGHAGSIKRIEIPKDLAALVDNAVSTEESSIGSVIGVIDRIITRGKSEFGLIDETSQTAVTVVCTKSQVPQVKALLDKRVCVTGELKYGANGRKTELTMWDLEHYPLPEDNVSFLQIVDLLKDVSLGGSAEEIVRELRG